MNILKNILKGIIMELTDKEREFIAKAPRFEDDLIEQLQEPEFEAGWLKLTLEEFLEDGDVNTFVRCLTYVVKARGRGEITKLANKSKIDRGNLSEILNGKVTPKLDTALKLIRGLGYKLDIKLKSA